MREIQQKALVAAQESGIELGGQLVDAPPDAEGMIGDVDDTAVTAAFYVADVLRTDGLLPQRRPKPEEKRPPLRGLI